MGSIMVSISKLTVAIGLLLGCADVAPGDSSEAMSENTADESEAASSCPPVFRTWEDPTVYPAGLNAYKRSGFYHPISWVHQSAPVVPAARVGERCTYYSNGFHLQTTIKANCQELPGGTLSCVGVCAP
jgi:hypothetical protein